MNSTSRTRARHFAPGTAGTLLTMTLLLAAATAQAQEKAAPDMPAAAPAQATAQTTPPQSGALPAASAAKPADNSPRQAGKADAKAPATPAASTTAPNLLTNKPLFGSLLKTSRGVYKSSDTGVGLNPASSLTGAAKEQPYLYLINPDTTDPFGLRAAYGVQEPQNTPPAKPAAPQATPPAPAADAGPPSRALPSPIENPPFPFTDWTINSGFPIGESWDVAPGTLQHFLFGKKLDNTKFRIGGWADAGVVVSNARDSNLPDTYNLIPNHPQLDQLVLVAQKMVDTTQKRYTDWGFYSAHLYGIDYRFTSATGYFSEQLTKHNALYGYDPVLQWGEVYLPKVADGTVIQFGRYISPIDIEAQLSNSNYLYSHSLMFGVDPYTYTGINAQVRVNKEFMYMIGIHAGNENSPWSGAANVNGEFLVGWNSASNRDSLWGGIDSISGSGKAVRGHDDEQIVNFVWGHVFNQRLHMQTQAYYMWEYDALVGGTPIIGPSEPFAGSGVGAKIPGRAYAIGFVNNLEYKVNKSDYISFRSGFLSDPQGWRTGAATKYTDFTLGYSHLFARNFWIRPEVRWDHSYDAHSFDNGSRSDLLSVSGDVIMRF